jgi:quercetin dioxygenase-like cupin family protein
MASTMIAPRQASGDWFADGADRARILVSGESTDGAWSLIEWVIAPVDTAGAPNYGPHRHRQCEETFIVHAGQLDFLLGQTVFHLEAGDAIHVPAGARHGYANVSGASVELLVSFHPAGLETLFEAYRTDREVSPPGAGFIADATRLFASEYEND